jgi:hypothetical protein
MILIHWQISDGGASTRPTRPGLKQMLQKQRLRFSNYVHLFGPLPALKFALANDLGGPGCSLPLTQKSNVPHTGQKCSKGV